MKKKRKENRRSSLLFIPLGLMAGFVLVVGSLLMFYRPDRPVADITPGSSSGPAFVVQVIRPRVGLPLGGLLPPGIFGVDAQLRFDSTSEGAEIRSVEQSRIELGADGWEFLLVFDGKDRINSETQIIFDFVFEDRERRVRCQPGDPAIGTLNIVSLETAGELSGSFDIELPHCEDAATGEDLGWPSQPLILHGSFDRLPLENGSE